MTDSLQGRVMRLLSRNELNGYTIVEFDTGTTELAYLIGHFPRIFPGQHLEVSGEWHQHKTYGRRFLVETAHDIAPVSIEGIEQYLGGGGIPDVGHATAHAIVQHFGIHTLQVLDTTPERLQEIRGIGPQRATAIAQAWQANQHLKEIIYYLQECGVSTSLAPALYQTYGNLALAQLTDNPYLLLFTKQVPFLTTDVIAEKLGLPKDDPRRIRGALIATLQDAGNEGDCALPTPLLIEKAKNLLQTSQFVLPDDHISTQLTTLHAQGQIVRFTDPPRELWLLPEYDRLEEELAERVAAIARGRYRVQAGEMSHWLQYYMQKETVALSEEQSQVVLHAAEHQMVVLTGGPGCGKTFTTKAIIALWEAMDQRIAVAAPTGRAAQRLGEVTGHDAYTLHRLLEFQPENGAFAYNTNRKLPYDAIVIDESSMLDLTLAHAFFAALAADTRVLLVGDVDQLPSVGAGQVLRDCIASGLISVARLSQVFRQSAESAIVRVAHEINRGDSPHIDPMSRTPHSQCLMVSVPDVRVGTRAIQHLLKSTLPGLGYPTQDIQILAPMIKGALGTMSLNPLIQTIVNPPRPGAKQILMKDYPLHVGDRVIQTMNNYDKNVYNGDIGEVGAITDTAVQVCFRDKTVGYDFPELFQLSPAWAITIHKSQGSEFPVVIIPIFQESTRLLSRNLVYTAITRARRLCILVATPSAFAQSIGQTNIESRYTTLAERLHWYAVATNAERAIRH